MVAPDDATFAYLEGRRYSPTGSAWDAAVDDWRSLATDPGATFDREVTIDASALTPVRHRGGPTRPRSSRSGPPCPARTSFEDGPAREAAERALAYMGLRGGTAVRDIAVDTVFIGSCTNGRIEDLRAAADVLRGRRVAPSVRALVVPGSGQVKAQAEAEGLDRVFASAGFEWRNPGCSMCLAMNPGQARPGRAGRLDLQPQLRRPPGPGRAHPPGVAGRGRRHRRRRALRRPRPTSTTGGN